MKLTDHNDQRRTNMDREFRSRHELAVAFGQRIRRLRGKKGLTQTGLATAMDCHWTTVNRIENGQGTLAMTLKKLFIVANIFGVKPSTLVQGIGYKHAGERNGETDEVNTDQKGG